MNKPVNKPPIGSIYFDEIISNKSMNECPNKIEKSYNDLNYLIENINHYLFNIEIHQNIKLDYLKEKTIGERSINMVKKIKKVAKALKKASALHKKQSKVIEKHIKEMKSYGKKKRS